MKELKKKLKSDHASIVIPLYNEELRLDYCFSVIKKFIQDDLQRGDREDPALDAYIESLQRDFVAGRGDAYSDYEMDDYVEDFQNYEADKMDS